MLLFFAFLLPFCINAQMYESFDHVEISYKYPWQGDADRFQTENGFLQLFDSYMGRDASLYVYGVTLRDNEWNFRLKSGYKTTIKNCQRVYIWNNSSHLSGEHTGYYVELGGDQTISLCKDWGLNAKEKLISRQINNLSKAYDIHVRVVSDQKKITLYARSDSNPEFTEIGSADYEPSIVPGYFILYAKYSQEHAKDKYFGPITIRNFSAVTSPGPGENPTQLTLQSFKQETSSAILLSFNQPVYPEAALFRLTSLGTADEVYISQDRTQIRLVWYDAMEKGKSYTLTYENLQDANQKYYTESLSPFIATIEAEAPKNSMGDVLINEVMADPKGIKGLPETEYVELRNTTDEAVDLTGWSFYYADRPTLLKLSIPAKGYAVLFREGREISVDKGGIPIPLATFPAQLANAGKKLQLRSDKGVLIDEFAYPAAKPGYSWERTGDAWGYSSDKRGGTPGSINSSGEDESEEDEDKEKMLVSPRELVFSELLPEPQVGGDEYVELYNRSDKILSLKGLAIAVRKADGSLNTHYPLSSIVRPLEAGEYRVLTKSTDGVLDFFSVSSPEKINEVKLPVLANTSSKLVLFRTKDQEVIDEVHYSEKWHAPSVKNKKGIALEKINLDGESQDPANWTSASYLSGGGTPGYANSQKESNNGATGIQEPEFITATGNYEIAYSLDRAGYMCRASIYDTSGRKVAEITNHELLGAEGILSWNGFASGGNKLSTGVYIFHAELYHPQGGRKAYKKVFLVR